MCVYAGPEARGVASFSSGLARDHCGVNIP